jgi:hypothetical protein
MLVILPCIIAPIAQSTVIVRHIAMAVDFLINDKLSEHLVPESGIKVPAEALCL